MKAAFAKIVGFGAIAGAMMMASSAMAAPAGAGSGALGVNDAPMVTTVASGCGRGFHRAPGGRCVRTATRHHYRQAPPPRHMRAPHRPVKCFMQRTPNGPRRVCR